EPDPQDEPPENGGIPPVARLHELQISQAFIQGLRIAQLDDSRLSAATIARLRSPSHEPHTITDLERAALRMFLARGDASEENYTDHRAAMSELHPEDTALPTYEQLKILVAELTGIHALREDMCINSCIAYTGPFAERNTCPYCSEPRYDEVQTTRARTNIPRRTFHTFPLGPQIQAM
ncbi:hypothetical protein C2E23DRAFT_702751, partial [Lenzites betulinus]